MNFKNRKEFEKLSGKKFEKLSLPMFLGSLPRNMGRLPRFLGFWTGFEIALTACGELVSIVVGIVVVGVIVGIVVVIVLMLLVPSCHINASTS